MFVIGAPDAMAIDIFSTPIPIFLSDIVGKRGYFRAFSRIVFMLATNGELCNPAAMA